MRWWYIAGTLSWLVHGWGNLRLDLHRLNLYVQLNSGRLIWGRAKHSVNSKQTGTAFTGSGRRPSAWRGTVYGAVKSLDHHRVVVQGGLRVSIRGALLTRGPLRDILWGIADVIFSTLESIEAIANDLMVRLYEEPPPPPCYVRPSLVGAKGLKPISGKPSVINQRPIDTWIAYRRM